MKVVFGFARLFIQRLAASLSLRRVIMLDDNILHVYEIDRATRPYIVEVHLMMPPACTCYGIWLQQISIREWCQGVVVCHPPWKLPTRVHSRGCTQQSGRLAWLSPECKYAQKWTIQRSMSLKTQAQEGQSGAGTRVSDSTLYTSWINLRQPQVVVHLRCSRLCNSRHNIILHDHMFMQELIRYN